MLFFYSIEDINNKLFEFLLQNTKNPWEYNEFLDKIKAKVKCFKCILDVQVYENLKKTIFITASNKNSYCQNPLQGFS